MDVNLGLKVQCCFHTFEYAANASHWLLYDVKPEAILNETMACLN